FEEFEDIGTPPSAQSMFANGMDDMLFGGGSLSPPQQTRANSSSAEIEVETLDEFEDLEMDLTRSLEDD
ncbi:hypothetical protein GGI02_003541, partial [Coemansia sp. RSA 2322]